jgi:hypothetical protein
MSFATSIAVLEGVLLCRTVVTMPDESDERPGAPTFRSLYPTLSEQELRDAEVNFTRYVEIVFEIHREERAKNDPAIDTYRAAPIIKERSNRSYTN